MVEDLCHIPTGPVKKISSGGYLTAALTEGNDLYVWGGAHGRLNILNEASNEPMPVDIEGADIIDMAVGFDHILALTLKGRLYAIGLGTNGQLGVNLRQLHQWTEIILFPWKPQDVVRVYAGYKTSFVITR